MKPLNVLIAFLLAAAVVASVAAESDAVVSYVEGSGFIVISEGVRKSYDIAADEVLGLPLNTGDTILTDDGSFVEVEMLAGDGGVIKVAENTTLTITSMDSDGGGVLQVVYGRIRIKVNSIISGSSLWVTGHDTVAGVRGTDFGYDLFYDRADIGGERQTSVYVFDGEVDVYRYDSEVESKIELIDQVPLVLKSGKMVKTKSSAPAEKMKITAIDDEIREYWGLEPIMTDIGLPDTESLTVSEELDLSPDEYSLKTRYETGGKIVFAAGVGMVTVGGLLRVLMPDNQAYLGLMTVGGTAITLGSGMMLYSISLP
jgi:hypothetical protein